MIRHVINDENEIDDRLKTLAKLVREKNKTIPEKDVARGMIRLLKATKAHTVAFKDLDKILNGIK